MKPLIPCLLLTALVLAGCAGGGGGGAPEVVPGGDVEDVEATATTGGIHGFVVDAKITPIAGADVSVEPGGKATKSNAAGAFVINDLEPGTYFVKASHPLYDTQQQSIDVVAGDADPDDMKFLLTRVVLQDPYLQTLKYDGFIVCSVNLVVVLSEECGEGVGVPCDVPAVGCQRVGGQGNNNVQFDFTVSAGAKTIIVEKNWEPTSDAGTALYSPIATEWSCLPSCSGNVMAEIDGESPLYAAISNDTFEDDVVPDTTIISVFTWASPSFTGAVANQKYTDFVTVFYHVPAPEGWSFVAGSPDPYK